MLKKTCVVDQERIKHANEQEPVVSGANDLVRTQKRPTRQQQKLCWFVKVNPILKLF